MKKSAHSPKSTVDSNNFKIVHWEGLLKPLLRTVDCRLWTFLSILAVFCFLSGCAPVGYEIQHTGVQAAPEEAIRNAENFIKSRPNWRIDCSHFVLACYHSPEMDRFFSKYSYLQHNLTKDLRIYLEQKKTRRAHAADIQPGDILIFNKTYDKNGDGRIDDKDSDTHCAIVESFHDMVVTYIDASEGRRPPRLHRRQFSFYDSGPNPHVATDPATGRRIRARETFSAAFGPPPP